VASAFLPLLGQQADEATAAVRASLNRITPIVGFLPGRFSCNAMLVHDFAYLDQPLACPAPRYRVHLNPMLTLTAP